MNTLGAWYNPLTWFDNETPEVSAPSGAGYTGAGNDLFGFNFDDWLGSGASTTTIIPGVSDQQKTAWDEYLASGGVMEPNFNAQAGTTSTDIFGGIGDFFDSLSKNIPSLVGLGLNTWQNVEAILAQQERASGVRDSLVFLPGTQTPVVKREQGGNVTYSRIADLYPQLAPQVRQAQSQNQLLGLALIGALGIGLIFIFRKK